MKKPQTFVVCLLIACSGWIGLHTTSAQQPAAQSSVSLTASRPGTTLRHLYLRGGKTHLIVQRTQTGIRVYRQVGRRMIPMN